MVIKTSRQYTQINQMTLQKSPFIWFKEVCNSHLEKKAWLLRWVEHGRDFRPAQLDMRFKGLTRKGITSYCVISSDTGLDSFQQLQENHDLDKERFYR